MQGACSSTWHQVGPGVSDAAPDRARDDVQTGTGGVCAGCTEALDHLADPVDIEHMVFITKAGTGHLKQTDRPGDGYSR